MLGTIGNIVGKTLKWGIILGILGVAAAVAAPVIAAGFTALGWTGAAAAVAGVAAPAAGVATGTAISYPAISVAALGTATFWHAVGTAIAANLGFYAIGGAAAGAAIGATAGAVSAARTPHSGIDGDSMTPPSISPKLAAEQDQLLQQTHDAGFRAAIARQRAAAQQAAQIGEPAATSR